MASSSLVTVIGGTGFLGQRIVDALQRAGKRVRVAARHPKQNSANVEFVRADVRDIDSIKAAVAGAEVVVNAVALFVEKKGLSYHDVHVEGAERVAACAAQAGVARVIHISGIGVDPQSPSAFVRARYQGEQRVQAAFPQAILVRPSVVFGRDDALVSSLETATRLPVVPLFGHGATRLQPAYVEDVAQAVALLCDSGTPTPETYELGGAEVCSYRECVQAVADHLHRKRVLVPFPFPLWRGLVGAMSVLPKPPLTQDQLALLEVDNVVSPGSKTFADLGLKPHSLRSALAQVLPVK